MTNEQAARVVVISGAGMATFVLIQAKRTGRPTEETFRSLWAVGAITLGLAVFADFAPQVAGPFALLVLIAMAARNKGAIGSLISGPGVQRAGTPRPYRSSSQQPSKQQQPGPSPGLGHQ